MEHWNHKSLQQHRFQNRRERQNPSFSSSLLDQIYRSIDQTHGLDEHEKGLVQTSIMKQTNCKTTTVFGGEELDLANFQRACLIEKWMDQKKKLSNEKILVRKKPAASAREFGRNSRQNRDSILLNSSSSSSDSSCRGLFSSEAESNCGVSSKSSSYTTHRPKPIRTSFSTQPERFSDEKINLSRQKSKHEGGGFVKTKSKVYCDLKKVRQPISPGGRLANFLNSIFSSSAASARKAKIYQEEEASLERKSKSAQASACPSASSFSRSCLSKTPSSSGGKSTKRSVRFYPVSVIVDEDCQPCGHKSLYQDKGRENSSNNNNKKNNNINIPSSARNSISEEISVHIREKDRCIEQAARDLLNNYQRKVECQIMEEDDDDDDDGASYASSDLFELDNISAIGGIERYCKELPVYETTYFDTNQAIASGLIM